MKFKKLLVTIIASLLFVGAFTVAHALSNTNSRVVEVRASESEEWTNFMNKYNAERAAHSDSVCDIPKDACDEILALYNKLSAEEKLSLNSIKDSLDDSFTIGQAINELLKKYYPSKEESDRPTDKISQSTAIIIVVVVSIVGMSAISVLYILKKDKVIE